MIEAQEALVSPGFGIERELECTSALDEAARKHSLGTTMCS